MGNWIKLYDSIIDNDVWRYDPFAWRIFEYLCLKAYTGKPQGTVRTTRQQIGNALLRDSSSCWKAILRLEKAKMVTHVGTARYSTFTICNWYNYQGTQGQLQGQLKDSSRTAEGHSYIDIDIDKDIDITTNVVIGDKPDKRKPEIDELFGYWHAVTGVPISSKIQANRYAASNLLKKHGMDRAKQFIRGVSQARADPYAPRIADFCALQSKLNELLVWGKQLNNGPQGVVKI